jgi:hypothetical protein
VLKKHFKALAIFLFNRYFINFHLRKVNKNEGMKSQIVNRIERTFEKLPDFIKAFYRMQTISVQMNQLQLINKLFNLFPLSLKPNQYLLIYDFKYALKAK